MTGTAAAPARRSAGGGVRLAVDHACGDSQAALGNPGDAARSKRYTGSSPVAHPEPPADFQTIPSEGEH